MKNKDSDRIHPIVARLIVLIFVLIMFILFRVVLNTNYPLYWDIILAITWGFNLFWITPLYKAFFNIKDK